MTPNGYAVIDLETTGLHPNYHHRVVEIAIVTLTLDGILETQWTTLLNPDRDMGPTHIHGIMASDVVEAPRFADVAGEVIAHIAGRILVAHNLRFDLAFLTSELRRVEAELDVNAGICTLGLADRFGLVGERSLPACCEAFGIEMTDHHAALSDAVATAMLLRSYMRLAGGPHQLAVADPVRTEPWPPLKTGHECVTRGSRPLPRTTLARFVASLPPGPELNIVDQEAAVEYLALLDRVLEDRTFTDEELAALSAIAAEWGIDQKDVRAMHWAYVEGVRRAAWADGHLSTEERQDILRVTQLLALDPAVAEMAASEVDAYRPPHEPLTGTTVCFTGESVCSINGHMLTRSEQMELAARVGATVVDSLTKKVNLLVLADPASMSGKARKAAQYGVRRVAEPVFWRMAGVQVD